MALNDNLQLVRRLGLLDPAQVAATTVALTRWGPTLAALYTASAVRHARRAAVIDHRGTATYAEIDRIKYVGTTALARLESYAKAKGFIKTGGGTSTIKPKVAIKLS